MNVSREINPFAYLNYVVFDENYILKDAGAMRVPDNAGFDPGMEIAVTPKQIAFTNPIRPQQKGYIYIWVSNESENTKVWFDDLKVTHRSRRVTQATDYYAYGSVLREQKTPEELTYRYKYQGQYAEKDEETGWNHFELREYDAVVGRWHIPDPYREFWSPYVAFGNNPVNIVDPRGGITDPKPGDLNQAGTQQWGLNGISGEYGWSDILDAVSINFNAGANRISTAMKYLGKYTYNLGRENDGQFLEDKFLDCSEFVLRVLKESDPDIYKKLVTTDKNGYFNQNTATMQTQIGITNFRKTNPKVGDLIMWGGHVELILKVNGGSFTTIGAGGGTGAVVPRIMGMDRKTGKYNWLNTSHKDIGTLGIGGYLGIWTPK